jgi:DNA polymerase-3 subunit delta
MFAPRRVVLVREVGALEGEPDALLEYAAAPPPDTHLIVRALDLDRRRKLHQALDQAGTVYAFDLPDRPDQNLVPDILALAQQLKLRLDRDAAALLGEICGGDLVRVQTELGKLQAWAGGTPVGLEAIREVGAGSAVLAGWEIADALLTRDRGAALAAVRRLVQSGESPLRLVGGLAYRTRSMLQAKLLGLDARASPGRLAGRLRVPEHVVPKLLQGVARYPLPELLAFPALLLEADRTLKSRDLAPQAVLESLVERMIGPGAGAAG